MAPPCPIRSGRCWPRPTACTGGGQRCWNATSTSRRSRSLLTNSAPCAGTLQAQAAERAMSPDAPTDSLHAQLDALAGWIREPATHAPPPGIEQRRLDVYRELFFNNVAGLLGGNFPVLRRIHGDERWQALVQAFYPHHERAEERRVGQESFRPWQSQG